MNSAKINDVLEYKCVINQLYILTYHQHTKVFASEENILVIYTRPQILSPGIRKSSILSPLTDTRASFSYLFILVAY